MWGGEDRTAGMLVRVRPLAGPAEQVARIAADARRAAQVEHANVEQVVEVLEPDGKSFLVVEHLEGATLAERLTGARGSLEEALLIGQQLAAGLAALHAAGVVHRAFEPAVVTYLGHGAVKTAAIALGSAPTAYRAPEQSRGEAGDAASDQYALAMVLYQLIAGKLPEGAPDLAAAVPGVPSDAAAAVMRALAAEPKGRFESMADFERALADAYRKLTGTPLFAVPPTGILKSGYARTRRRRGGGFTRVYQLPGLGVDTGLIAFVLGVFVLAGIYYIVVTVSGSVLGGLRAANMPRKQAGGESGGGTAGAAGGAGNFGSAVVGGAGVGKTGGGRSEVGKSEDGGAAGLGGACPEPRVWATQDERAAYIRCRLRAWLDGCVRGP